MLSDEDENPVGEVAPLPNVGVNIEVNWPDDNQFYPGKVTSFTPKPGDIQIN